MHLNNFQVVKVIPSENKMFIFEALKPQICLKQKSTKIFVIFLCHSLNCMLLITLDQSTESRVPNSKTTTICWLVWHPPNLHVAFNRKSKLGEARKPLSCSTSHFRQSYGCGKGNMNIILCLVSLW